MEVRCESYLIIKTGRFVLTYLDGDASQRKPCHRTEPLLADNYEVGFRLIRNFDDLISGVSMF